MRLTKTLALFVIAFLLMGSRADALYPADGSSEVIVASSGPAGSDWYGSTADQKLKSPIVGIESTTTGKGYWEVASDGGVFSYGDAVYSGSTGSLKLNRPIVGMAKDPDGKGYWLVASDGGVFSFDAEFHGSAGSLKLNSPIVAMRSNSNGQWILACCERWWNLHLWRRAFSWIYWVTNTQQSNSRHDGRHGWLWVLARCT